MRNLKKYGYKPPDKMLTKKRVHQPTTILNTHSWPKHEDRLEGPAPDALNPDKHQFLDLNRRTAM